VISADDRGEPTGLARRLVPALAAESGMACVCLLLLVALLTSTNVPAASGHVIMGTKSLHLRVVEVDLVVRARVIDPEAVFVSEDGSTRRRLIEIEILEELKGRAGAKRVHFAQDGHDVALYKVGQEALFFLEPIAKSRELRALAVPGGPTHFSGQEHNEQFVIDGPYGPVLLSATRALASSESAATADERIALIRGATLDLLTSGDSQLGASALASLVLTPDAEIVTKADLPRLEKLLANPSVSIGFRAGLVAELERRGLVEGSVYWLALLQNASPKELPVAIRAAGVHPSEQVNAFLLERLEDPNSKSEIAAEAAMALGASQNVAMVDPLADALMKGKPRLSNAAIRALGQIGGPEARQALEHAARTHPDSATRRRALAKLRAGEALSARSDAP
jgi:hypothetical protein